MYQVKTKNIYKANVYSVLTIRLLIILGFLAFSRISLYIFNSNLFSGFSFFEIAQVFINGLRFDLSIIFMLGALLIIGNALPLGFRRNPIYQNILNTITLIAFSIAIIFNFIDVVYYRFTLKRMTFDIFYFIKTNGGFLDIAPKLFIDFWYISLLAILIYCLLYLNYAILIYHLI